MVLLVAVLACGGNDRDPNGQPGDPPAAADAGAVPDADVPAALERCGLDFEWLDPSTMGKVIASDDSVDPFSIVEATLFGVYLRNEGFPLSRSSDYETHLHTVRYQTQDRGQTIEATGMVIVPTVDDPEEFPVLLFLHGTTGLNDQCAPSRNLDDDESPNFQAAALLSLIASYGYIVVAPDYIGQKATGSASPELHPYLVGEPTAIASWDSVRAAKKFVADLDETEATPGKIAVWGASQGGHAAAFTVRYAGKYAPEMDIAGAVYSIPPLDLATHWQQGIFSLYSATANIILAFSASADWYRVDGGLSDVLVSPFDETVPAALKEECAPETLNHVTDTNQVFTPGIMQANLQPALGGDPQWNCIVRENTLLTTSVPREELVPALVILGENDTLVETATERAAFTEMCAQGENWAYLECEDAEHTEAFYFSLDDALDFLDDRLAGKPMPEGSCAVAPAQKCSNQP
ncbi:MAG: lipase family protein [Deltaproteobacteria bacterium]|nr:lipase family protein [Deltaproteobacteria bacterium]